MDIGFEGKVASVTGAASGIGEAVARGLAAAGTSVLIVDSNPQRSDVAAQSILASGGKVAIHTADVSDAAEIQHSIGAAVRIFSRLDLAVNNAGIAGALSPTGAYSPDGWRRVIDTNLSSVFYCLRYEIPAIQASGGGAIVDMSSILSSVGFANAPAYAAAKHGIECARHNIRINAIGPGFIDTPMLSAGLEVDDLVGIRALHPIGRLGTSVKLASLTLFLLSPAASFITGSYHLVDGGYTAL